MQHILIGLPVCPKRYTFGRLGMERKYLLHSSEMIRRIMPLDVETAEAVEFLTGMREVTAPVDDERTRLRTKSLMERSTW